MSSNSSLVDRVRNALAAVSAVEEKKMFGSLAFMVNGKMCLAARADRIMCRIDPLLHADAIAQPGCSAVVMKGRQYIGYIHVQASVLGSDTVLQHWVSLALAYNKMPNPAKVVEANHPQVDRLIFFIFLLHSSNSFELALQYAAARSRYEKIMEFILRSANFVCRL